MSIFLVLAIYNALIGFIFALLWGTLAIADELIKSPSEAIQTLKIMFLILSTLFESAAGILTLISLV